MFGYLQKFNSLPPEIREKVSSPAVSAKVADLGKKYGLNLATVVIKVAVKDIAWVDLAWHLSKEFSVDQNTAQLIADDLGKNVFYALSDYLGAKIPAQSVDVNKDNGAIASPVPSKPLAEQTRLVEIKEPANVVAVVEPKKVAPTTVIQPPREASQIINPPLPANVGLTSDVANLMVQRQRQQEDKKDEMDSYDDLSMLHNERVEKILEEVVSNFQVEFSSAYFAERFKKIIFTYLRGVRDKVNTRHSLSKSVESGGLGFDEAVIDRVFKVADTHISELREVVAQKQLDKKDRFENEQKNILGSQVKKEMPVRDVEYDLAAVLAQKKKEESLSGAPENSTPESNTATKVTADNQNAVNKSAVPSQSQVSNTALPDNNPKDLPPVVNQVINSAPNLNNNEKPVLDDEGDVYLGLEAEMEAGDKAFQGSLPATKPSPVNTVKPSGTDLPQVKAQDFVGGKRKMEDVKYVPRTMGPVEELLYMDLVNFHRLARNPYDACDKLKAKIKLLEEDNYAKKIEGIRAWRQSYVNKIYLEIGQESIEKGKPVEMVIKDRKEQGREYLTNEEFEAVMDLNRFLRF